MGEQDVSKDVRGREVREFTRSLLEDLAALERMIREGRFESGVGRIGAELELFLVDDSMRPAYCSERLLEGLDPASFKPELGRFNLEANLQPREFDGQALRLMEEESGRLVSAARHEAQKQGAHVLMAGILPTLRKSDLGLDAMTPTARFRELNRVLVERRGSEFQLFIKGLDELQMSHDSLMFEACNTSFQIHFQVSPEQFARAYNLAQVATGPLLACAVNSPLFLQHRLWQETRVALFQQSLDSRSSTHMHRDAWQRVIFGESWVESSVTEIFREDIARFRVLLAAEVGESSMAALERGELPELRALRLHNGTVYRWNRPCIGIVGDRAHLRIEHRALPAGPSIIDQMANAALFFGLMVGLDDCLDDPRECFSFDDVKANFTVAARYGLKAQLRWTDGRALPAQRLILEELLPLAHRGLISRGVPEEDVARYLGVIEQRVAGGQTGAQWMLDTLAGLKGLARPEQSMRTLTAAMLENQRAGTPVHDWPHTPPEAEPDWVDACRYVEQVMTTDLFCVGPDDLVDLAATLMDWEHIRHVPVEDEHGRLVGIVSHRQMVRIVGHGIDEDARAVPVSAVMKKDPITVTPRTRCIDAIDVMRRHRVSALPVVEDGGRLVGIVTERDFVNVAARLLEDRLRG